MDGYICTFKIKCNFNRLYLEVHSDAPGQRSVEGVEVKQNSDWIVPATRKYQTGNKGMRACRLIPMGDVFRLKEMFYNETAVNVCIKLAAVAGNV